jgi:hypothetical protein
VGVALGEVGCKVKGKSEVTSFTLPVTLPQSIRFNFNLYPFKGRLPVKVRAKM